MLSTNMLLPIPVVGVTIGPEWATNVNSCLTIIDQHNHSAGSGVQITPDGLNINADLSMQNNNLILSNSVEFIAQSVALSSLRSIYAIGLELYYNDGAGNNVQITNGGSVAGSTGNITNLTPPAAVVYSNISKTFTFQSDVTTPANLDAASIVLRNLLPSSKGLTLAPPNAMSADYGITLPSLPASKKIVTMTTGGALAADYDADNVTLEVSGNNLQIKDLGVSTAKIAALAVTTAKIDNLAVTTAKIDAAAVTLAKMASNSVDSSQIVNQAVGANKLAVQNYAESSVIAAGSYNNGNTLGGVTYTTSANSGRLLWVVLSQAGGGLYPPSGGAATLQLRADGVSIGTFNLNDGVNAGPVTTGDLSAFYPLNYLSGSTSIVFDATYFGPNGLQVIAGSSKVRVIEL